MKLETRKFLLIVLVLLACCWGCTTARQKRESDLHYKLGLAQLRSGQYETAFVEFQKALQYDDGDKDTYNALGYVYLKWNDPDKAKKAFSEAVDIDPGFSEGYNNLCLVEYRLGNYRKAAAYCKKALLNPLYATPEKAFFNLGLSMFKLKKYHASIKALTGATTRNADYYPAYYELAILYNMTGDYGDASRSLQSAVASDPRFKGDMQKAENYFQTGGALPWCPRDGSQILEVFNY